MPEQVLREEKPACFGRVDDPANNVEGWNPQNNECTGGIDPAYTDDRTGSHVRGKCLFFSSCGAISQAKRLNSGVAPAQPQYIPASAIARRPAEPQVPSFLQKFAQQVSLQEQQVAAQQAASAQLAVQQRAYQAPPPPRMLPMNYPAQTGYPMQPPAMPVGYPVANTVNYQVSAPLTVPEQLEGGAGGYARAFGITILRSMGKSLGHSIAHLFDTLPFGGPPRSGQGG